MKKILPFLLFFACSVVLWGQWTCGDTLYDIRDGKKYPTVQIGNQCWMAKSLNVGNMISGLTFPANNGIIEKYCYDDDPLNCETYGGLYTWHEMMNYYSHEGARGICPEGWHVPSDNEIKQLEIALGMDSAVAELYNTWRGTDQGTQMLAGGTSGLNILFSGCRTSANTFMLLNAYAYIYTSSSAGTNAWRRCLKTNDSTVGRFNTFPKEYAFSVRCLLGIDSITVSSDLNREMNNFSCYYYDNTVVLNYNLAASGHMNLQVSDLTGRIVFMTTISFHGGNGTESVQVHGLAKGIYILTAQTGSLVKNGKFVVP